MQAQELQSMIANLHSIDKELYTKIQQLQDDVATATATGMATATATALSMEVETAMTSTTY